MYVPGCGIHDRYVAGPAFGDQSLAYGSGASSVKELWGYLTQEFDPVRMHWTAIRETTLIKAPATKGMR
jgi:hypothetical protein